MYTAKKILEMRKVLGITQEYVARIFEISPKTVYRWESGKANPRGSVSKKLMALDILIENEQMREECIKLVKRPDGLESLQYLINQIVPKMAGKTGTLAGIERMLSDVLPSIYSISPDTTIKTKNGMPGSMALFAAYKVLHRLFKDTDPETFIDEEQACMVCKKSKPGKLYRCTGKLSDNSKCGFVVCEDCIYKSKKVHIKKFPDCDKTAVPSFEHI